MDIDKLIIEIVKGLVDEPSGVSLNISKGEDATIYVVEVSKEDVGKVIGKKGRTVSAIRTIIKSIAKKFGERVELEIVE